MAAEHCSREPAACDVDKPASKAADRADKFPGHSDLTGRWQVRRAARQEWQVRDVLESTADGPSVPRQGCGGASVRHSGK